MIRKFFKFFDFAIFMSASSSAIVKNTKKMISRDLEIFSYANGATHVYCLLPNLSSNWDLNLFLAFFTTLGDMF